MFGDYDSPRSERGLSARYLLLIFLAGVAVCAVFFSLGFLVGFNERASSRSPVTENLTTPGAIPPTVNGPLPTTTLAPSSDAVPPPVASAPSESQGAPGGEPPPATAPSATSAPSSPEPAKNIPEPAAAGGVGSGLTVQVVASRSKQDAERIVKILESRGYSVFLVTPEFARANDNLYRVQVGPFASREAAEKVRSKLAKEGFKPFIRH